jgi:hypothetical protein
MFDNRKAYFAIKNHKEQRIFLTGIDCLVSRVSLLFGVLSGRQGQNSRLRTSTSLVSYDSP